MGVFGGDYFTCHECESYLYWYIEVDSLEPMDNEQCAYRYLSGALDVAAEYIQNGVRRATNDW